MRKNREATAKRESKVCMRCARPFTNRKKWASRGQWDQVLYCSKKCQNG
ncbi:MAG: DUF2256 domain-containing protein [Angustibacter sp.]